MREVVFKHLTSVESRKKNILLKEVFEKDGVTANTERRCFYFIKDIRHLDGDKGLQEWMKERLLGEKCIDENDLYLYHIVDEPEEVVKIIKDFYRKKK